MNDAPAYVEAAARAHGVTLSSCHFLQIQVGVLKCESVGQSSRDWPVPVLMAIDKELNAWRGRNRDRKVVASHSYAVQDTTGMPVQCVVELYHAHIEQLAPERSSVPVQPAAPPSPAPPRCAPCGE